MSKEIPTRTPAGPGGSVFVTRHDFSFVPALIILAALTFNAALAFINGNVTSLTSGSVIAVEIALVGAAHLVALANYKPQMTPWYVFLACVTLIAVFCSFFFGEIEIKHLRNMLLIPSFVVLGMACNERLLSKIISVAHILVLVVLLLEAIDVSAYANLFKTQDYYINTRGYDVENFWNKESELFVSATRPDERLFKFVDLHRLSSLFLEPVSLGNYAIVISAFTCAYFNRLSALTRWFLILGNLVIILGCDGRLAVMTSIAIIAVTVVAPFMPRVTALFYAPLAIAGAFFVVILAGLQAGPDDLPGRVAHTVVVLQHYDVLEFLGLSNRFLSVAVDSGIAYLITTQSLVGTALLWLIIVYGSSDETFEQIRLTHAVCMYFALTFLVSFAFLTIKTAALLWFVYGALNSRFNKVGYRRTPHARSPRFLRPIALTRRNV